MSQIIVVGPGPLTAKLAEAIANGRIHKDQIVVIDNKEPIRINPPSTEPFIKSFEIATPMKEPQGKWYNRYSNFHKKRKR